MPAPNAYDPPHEWVTHTRRPVAGIGTEERKGVVKESYCSELYAVTMHQIQLGRGLKKVPYVCVCVLFCFVLNTVP